MDNNIYSDRVFIEIDGTGAWIDCSDLSANSWAIYETFAEHLETELEKVAGGIGTSSSTSAPGSSPPSTRQAPKFAATTSSSSSSY